MNMMQLLTINFVAGRSTFVAPFNRKGCYTERIVFIGSKAICSIGSTNYLYFITCVLIKAFYIIHVLILYTIEDCAKNGARVLQIL